MNDPLKEAAEKLWNDWKEDIKRRRAEDLARQQIEEQEENAQARRVDIAMTAFAIGYTALVLVLIRFLTR